jgi:hypothetical protein
MLVITVINSQKYPIENLSDGLNLIYKDAMMMRQEDRVKALVGMSINWPRNDPGHILLLEFVYYFAVPMKKFISEGVSIVTGSGSFRRQPINGCPALYAEPQRTDLPLIPELIVVGAVDNLGFRWSNS